jgi:hypothetical protein
MQIGKMLVPISPMPGDTSFGSTAGACNCEYVLLGVHRENLNGFAD